MCFKLKNIIHKFLTIDVSGHLKLKTHPKHATCPVCRKNVISEEEAQAAQQIQDDIFRPTFLNIIPYLEKIQVNLE